MLTEAIEETDTNAHIRIRVRRNSFRILRNILPISVSRFNSHNSRFICVFRHVVVSHITLMSVGNMYLWLCVYVYVCVKVLNNKPIMAVQHNVITMQI